MTVRLPSWGGGGMTEFDVLFDSRSFLRGDFVVTFKTVFLLGALGARSLPHPRQFFLQKHLAFVLHHRVGGLALGFVQQVIRVIAAVRPEFAHRTIQ